MTKLKVVSIDDNDVQLRDACPAITRHFQQMGYEIDITAVVLDPRDKARQRELDAVFDLRPDVVFCDNHFGEEPGLAAWGFQFVSKQKVKFPDIVFILLTKENFKHAEFSKSVPHPHIIVDRTKFKAAGRDDNGRIYDAQYRDFFREEFKRVFLKTKIRSFDIGDEVWRLFAGMRSKGERKVPPTRSEIYSLLEQVCFMGRQGRENALDGISLGKIDGGLSGSAVCTLQLSDSGRPYRVPGVVKISTKESALLEVENHNKYVKWMVPYTWRVDVLGMGVTQEFGAVCYSFAHGGSEKPISLASVLMERGAEQGRQVIESVFDPGCRTWYEQVRDVEDDIGAYLSMRRPYFNSANDRPRKADLFRSLVDEICSSNGIKQIKGGGVHIVDLAGKQINLHDFEQRIYSSGWDGIRVRECIGHGDMNAGNLMVKPNSADFAFIDFRHTGWHHLSRDFCSVEGSIRTLYPREQEVKGFVAYFERELERQNEEAAVFARDPDPEARLVRIEQYQKRCSDALAQSPSERELISIVRSLYHRNFPDSYFTEYALCMLTHAWWLACFDKTWVQSQREILVAEVLALLCVLWKL